MQAGAELYVQVFDFDSNSDDLIVRYRFDLSPLVGSIITLSTSSNNGMAIFLNATVLCAPFYIGSSCDVFNHCESNAVTCSDQGKCTNNGDSFTCVCGEPGYTGADCETNIDDCVNRNCSGNGVCVDGVNSFSCECVYGFTGEMCSVEETRGKHILIIPTSGGLISIEFRYVISYFRD